MKLVVVAGVLVAKLAHAGGYYDPAPGAETDDHDDGPYATAAVHFGLGAPLGLFGVEGGVGADWFRGAIGVGVGLRGLELGAMTRVFTTISGLDVGIGIGVSRGPGTHELHLGWRDPDEPDTSVQFANDTTWGNVELAVEVPLTSYGATRFFAGASYAISIGCEVERHSTDSIEPCNAGEGKMLEDDAWMPYAGVAFVLRYPQAPRRQTFQLPGSPP